ncbi:TetR/AcrR family transcriptional regulator [Haloechinothrix salitolerans]
MEQVCRHAGVSKGVFAHHFPGGKRALVAACLERNGEEFTWLLDEAVAHSGSTTADVVRALFGRYADLMREHGTDVGCPMAAAAVEGRDGIAGPGSPTAAAVAHWRTEVASRYTTLAGNDELLLTALEGALVLARATGDPGVLDRVGDQLASLFADCAGP